MKELVCCYCGRVFLFYRKKKYCSDDCRIKKNSGYNPNCIDCGRPKMRSSSFCELCAYLRKADRGQVSRLSFLDGECKYCHNAIPRDTKHNQPRVWCSNSCRLNYRKRASGAKSKCVKYWEPKPAEISRVDFLNCQLCGSTYCYSAGGHRKRLACPTCYTRWPTHILQDVLAGNMEKNCTRCGVLFSSLPGTGYRTCSTECAKASERAAKAKRRKHIRGGENIDPFAIFMRDGWRCKCCGRRTPKRLRGTIYKSAPELDHIIPLSKGGKHTRQNVQLLCRACNNQKSDGSLSDQQLLFG